MEKKQYLGDDTTEKRYLGDDVYAEMVKNELWLTRENTEYTSDTIYLNEEVIEALLKCIADMKEYIADMKAED